MCVPYVYTGNNINLNGDFLQSGAQAIRVVDPTNLNYTLIGQLDRTRVGVTLTTLGDGNILIMGGNQQVTLLLLAAQMLHFIPFPPASWDFPHSNISCQSHRCADADTNIAMSVEYKQPCIVAVAALLARQLSQQQSIPDFKCIIPDNNSTCGYRKWVRLQLTPNLLPQPTPPPPAAPTWEARLLTLTMTTQASASSTVATTARVPPSPWHCCWKHGLSTPTLMSSSCPQAPSLLLQVVSCSGHAPVFYDNTCIGVISPCPCASVQLVCGSACCSGCCSHAALLLSWLRFGIELQACAETAHLQLLAACLLFCACRPVLPFALFISILSAYLYC